MSPDNSVTEEEEDEEDDFEDHLVVDDAVERYSPDSDSDDEQKL